MQPYFISERWEYDYIVSRGFEPLLDTKHFRMDIRLRIAIQREKFGTGHTPEENEKFYRWVWEHKPHYCECCMRPLPNYSATFVSHILTRGAHPETAYDCRNVNIFCFLHHSMWENGNRKNMRIYRHNLRIIDELKKEYSII